MSIKIYTEKIVTSGGIKSYKILDIKCLPADKLPELYLNGKNPVIFKSSTDKSLILRNAKHLSYCFGVDQIVSSETFIDLLDFILRAGEHLKSVNKKLNKLKKEWNGFETFII